MTKKVGIAINKLSYMPEAYAYADFLRKRGVEVQLAEANLLDPLLDVHIYFLGLLPFFRKKGNWREIHEYHSLSVPKLARIKDYLKKTLNRKPDGRIFLNSKVESAMSFNDSIPFIYRDMGVDQALFQQPTENSNFDIVYSGSIDGRIGLLEEIKRLNNLGFRILIIGKASPEAIRTISCMNNVTFTGYVKRDELPSLYRQCRFGLNYTPNLYPFNIQTSTKTLEYLASGLVVLSNRYAWAEMLQKEFPNNIVWLDSVLTRDSVNVNFTFDEKILNYSWDKILTSNDFFNFIMKFQ